MLIPIISTKLNMPPLRLNRIHRPRLTERLNTGKHRKLTLVSASAGFGKTTAVCEWLCGLTQPVSWLSLDVGDNDPLRFLTYLVAALQKAGVPFGEGMFPLLQSPQPPPIPSLMTNLINAISNVLEPFILVLDDYHVIHASSVDHIVNFLLDHLPSQMHLAVIAREDPRLSISRMRVLNQLNEVRAGDLRFTSSEASDFLVRVMGLRSFILQASTSKAAGACHFGLNPETVPEPYSFRYASGVMPSFWRNVATKWLASRNPTASPMQRTVQSGREGSHSFALRSRS